MPPTRPRLAMHVLTEVTGTDSAGRLTVMRELVAVEPRGSVQRAALPDGPALVFLHGLDLR